jgi:hypothetical protein
MTPTKQTKLIETDNMPDYAKKAFTRLGIAMTPTRQRLKSDDNS